MTVGELIEALKKFDLDKPVFIDIFEDGRIDCDEVSEVFDPAGDGVPMII